MSYVLLDFPRDSIEQIVRHACDFETYRSIEGLSDSYGIACRNFPLSQPDRMLTGQGIALGEP